MRHNWIYIFILVCGLIQQCAKQTAPTGGPKDITPPVLINSTPSNEQVNFKGTEVQLSFDELIQLNNPREQIIITPSIGKKFEATARKNKVTLVFNSELQDSTTYSINFRESIQDLTEKNPAIAKLAFSTGSYIDSMFIAGTTTDILSGSAVPNYTVAVVPASDTFNIFKHTASWITLTDKRGKFLIENLKPGNYFIYAFDDKNRNLIVDTKSEKYGFKSDNLFLQGKTDSVKLNTFKLDAANLKLIVSRPTFAYFSIRFSKGLAEYTLSPSDAEKKVYSILESDKTTIKIYNTFPDLDSLQVRVQAQDSIQSKVDTLLYVKFQKKESTKDKFSSQIEYANFYTANSTFSSVINFSKPITQFNPDSLYVQLDSLTKILFSQTEYQWNETLTKLTLNKKINIVTKSENPTKEKNKEGTKGQEKPDISSFILASGAIISVENDTADRASAPLKHIKPEDFGMILPQVQTKEDFILQLVDKSNKLIAEFKNKKNPVFENILPGNYSLRLMIDLNKNGKWDAGNYATKQQPEPIIYYRDSKGEKNILLKANWQREDLLISY
jgi:uncharacterized protein (DUF2141 family)